ncbi:hypothetical protein RYX36_011075, partial [Vicia faba]
GKWRMKQAWRRRRSSSRISELRFSQISLSSIRSNLYQSIRIVLLRSFHISFLIGFR